MKGEHTKKIFILGCERSGSTWLANIFDANSAVISYLEPFADYTNLFLSFPPRYIHIDKADDRVVKRVAKGIEGLYGMKYPFLYKPGRNSHLIKIDERILYPRSTLHRKEIYRLLNLNQERVVPKNGIKDITVEIIKELRLNFKVGLLKQMFPEVKVLVSIRHPVLQVDSILSWFRKGNLGELRRSLEHFFTSIKTQKRFESFHLLLRSSDLDNEKTALYLYWLINYEVLLEDLEKNDVECEVIKNEDLVRNGLNALGASFSEYIDESVLKYFENSSSGSDTLSSPTSTNRDSKQYLIEKMNLLNRKDAIFEALIEKHDFKAVGFYR
ncbi:MAG: sulfotransferase [Cyclobacteriaceae bacterium]